MAIDDTRRPAQLSMMKPSIANARKNGLVTTEAFVQ